MEIENNQEQQTLEADELLMLGERILKEREYGEAVQQDVTDRTADIVWVWRRRKLNLSWKCWFPQ